MLNFIDSFLNRITMYRLVLYVLIAILLAAVILSFSHVLFFDPITIIYSTLVLLVVSWAANKIFAIAFKVPANVESDYITALILALLITPSMRLQDLPFLVIAAVAAQASKYILGYQGKHFFNPAAFAVALTALTINQSASWWVGTMWMLPVVVVGGLLVVRKIQRFDLFLSFLITALAVILTTSFSHSDPLSLATRILVDSPILFFAFIMLTEPLTSPPTRALRITYGILVGLLFSPSIHLGSFYLTPELSLLVGNIFSYVVSPKRKFVLTLKSDVPITTDIRNFIFETKHKLNFQPGQYMEWTIDPKGSDNRGNRRYFTLASSPTESVVHLGVRFYEKPSTFKQKLFSLKPGDQILAGQLAGDFTLPNDKQDKLVFLAGGIGITPFRSMLKYLVDTNEKRDITLFYSNYHESEVAFRDVLDEAKAKLGTNIIYVNSDKNERLTSEIIQQAVPNPSNARVYISGSHGFVSGMLEQAQEAGVPRTRIKTDFFPGFV